MYSLKPKKYFLIWSDQYNIIKQHKYIVFNLCNIKTYLFQFYRICISQLSATIHTNILH